MVVNPPLLELPDISKSFILLNSTAIIYLLTSEDGGFKSSYPTDNEVGYINYIYF